MGHTAPAARRPKTTEPTLTLTGAELVEILWLVAARDIGVAEMLADRAGVSEADRAYIVGA